MSNMIELQLQRMKSTTLTKSSSEQSPEVSPQRSRERFIDRNMDDEEEKKPSQAAQGRDSDEEFYDCLDDAKDAKMLENNMLVVTRSEPSLSSLNKPIRRTASFSEFNQIDEDSGEDDCDGEDTG